MARVTARKKSNVGVAISTNRIVAWVGSDTAAGAGMEWEQPVVPMPPTASEWPELEVALRALATETGGGSLFIALLPPLVQVRAVQLPPVDEEDAVRLITRASGKFFIGAREPQVVSVRALERAANGAREGQNTQALASAAAVRVVQAIRDAAEGAGWKVARVVPAQSAWLTAADHVWSKSDALVDHGRLIVIDGDRTEVIVKRGGSAETFRHLRGLEDDGDKLLEAVTARSITSPAASRNGLRPVGIIGDDVVRRRLAPVLRERGLLPMESEGVWSKVVNSAPLAAAHFAPLTQDLELVTEETRGVREQARRTLAARLGVLSLVLALAAVGVQQWGLARELDTIRAKRDSVRTAVAAIVDARSKIGSMGAPIAAIDSMRGSAIRWSVVLSDIAQSLSTDAYLESFRAREDSIAVRGRGKDAGSALESLRRAASLRDVTQAGQIRRDLDMANFEVVARVRRDTAGGRQE